MNKLLIRSLIVGAFVMALSFTANAQKGDGRTETGSDSAGIAVLKGTGKAAVVVVGTAGKIVWETTKFAAKHVAKPIIVGAGKPMLLKLAPRVTVLALRLAGQSIKSAVPMAGKLGFAYLKAKLPI